MLRFKCVAVPLAVLVMLCGLFLLGPTSQALATTYYVATNGDDLWPGTEAEPWEHIQKAADTMVAGDTVLIKEGTYEEAVVAQNSGSVGSMITYQAYPGHTVNITLARADVFTIDSKSYIRLEDLQITGKRGDYGVLLKSATNIELVGLTVGSSKWECIEVIGSSGPVLIEYCDLGPSTNSAAVDVATYDIPGRPHDVTIRYCDAHDCPFAGLDNELADRIHYIGNTIWNTDQVGVDAGSGDDMLVRDNVIYGSESGIALSSNENSLVYDNTVYDIENEAFFSFQYVDNGEDHLNNSWYRNLIHDAGFGLFDSDTWQAVGYSAGHKYYNNLFYNIGYYGSYRAPFWIEGVKNIQFYNNTLHLNDHQNGIKVLAGGSGGATGGRIFNNIIEINDGGSTWLSLTIDEASQQNTVADYNCYWDRYDGTTSGPGANSIVADPEFVNPGTGDFHLEITSLCIDAGTSGISPAVAPSDDLDGNSRPQDEGYDIGCYEIYVGAQPPVADFSGNPTTGPPTLTVYFTDLSTGDPTSWDWTFGDGGTSQAQHPSHDYTSENTYTVGLTAYNAQGQDTETKTDYITVTSQSCHVGAIDMADGGTPAYKAQATITVHDQDCVALSGVTVDITWSGAVSGTDSAATNEYGQVVFISDRNKSGGTFTCCVDNLTKTGYPYSSGDNHETCDSITLP